MSSVASILTHTCDIYRRGSGTADFGNPSGSFALAYSGIACRKHERESAMDYTITESANEQSVVWFLLGVDVAQNDQLDFSGVRYDVESNTEDVAGAGEIVRVKVRRTVTA